MAETIAAISAYAAQAAFVAASNVGLSVSAAATVANIAYAATYVATTLAVSAGINAALSPNIPDPEASQSNLKQARPARRYLVGTTRVSGAVMFRETLKNVYNQVYAFPEGPVAGYGRNWLNDDLVSLNGSGHVIELPNGRYETGRAKVFERYGAETETNYPILTAAFPTKWPANARGDGIPSTYLNLENGKLADAQKQFPAGVATEMTREAFGLAYDWREPGADRDDPSTWVVTGNVVVWTVNVLWRRYGADWDRRFAPALDILTAEADICDEPVALKAGGTEPRYQVGFWFESTTPRKVVLQTLLNAMDGHFSIRRDGAYIIRAGHYYEPTIIFGDEEIMDYTFNPGPTPDQVVNVLAVSFCDPANNYTTVETDSRRNQDSIDALGEEKTGDFTPKGVQNNSQVGRLGKAALDRSFSPDGTFRTPLSARRGLGQRFVRVRIEEQEDLNNAVVEIVEASIELETASIMWTYRVTTGGRYAWNPATEEGDGPAVVSRPPPESLAAPAIDYLTPFYAQVAENVDGVKVRIGVIGPTRDDLTWFYRFRTFGDTSWTERPGDDIDPGPAGEFDTGEFLPVNTTLEFQAAYKTGGGTLSPWSVTDTIVTSTDSIAPGPPTAGAATSPGAGQIHVTWRNPTSANFDHARIWRGSSTDAFGAAVSQGTVAGAANALAVFDQTGVTAGSYRIWITAENAANTASPPIGPFAVTVT